MKHYNSPQLEKFILPVDFSSNKKQSVKSNIETTKKAKQHLLNNGALIVFPLEVYLLLKVLNQRQKMMPGKVFLQN